MKLLSASALAACIVLAGCATTPPPATAPTYVDTSRYRAVVVESVHIAPAAASLTDAERTALENKLRWELVNAFPVSARAVDPGPGVLRLAITVTQLDASSPTMNAVTTALLLVPLDHGGIAFDAEFFDSAGGPAIGSTTVRFTSTPVALKGSFSRYGHAVGALRDWGAEFASSLSRS